MTLRPGLRTPARPQSPAHRRSRSRRASPTASGVALMQPIVFVQPIAATGGSLRHRANVENPGVRARGERATREIQLELEIECDRSGIAVAKDRLRGERKAAAGNPDATDRGLGERREGG